MNQLFASLALVAVAAPPAAADPVGLDYRASDPSCIDAGRFADEVSAKLGFVPWDDGAPAKIRVRVERDAERFTGSFRNVDDSAKIIDGATCADVTATLAVTVAAAVDRSRPVLIGAVVGPAQPAAKPGPKPADDRIPVRIVEAEGRRVDVSLNDSGGVATTRDGTQVIANYFDTLCTSPCTARLPRGRHYLRFQDPDAEAVGGERFLIDQPTTITLHHKSHKTRRRGLFVTGLLMTTAGLVGVIGIDGAAAKIGGSLGLGFGLGFMVAPLYTPDTFTATTRTP